MDVAIQFRPTKGAVTPALPMPAGVRRHVLGTDSDRIKLAHPKAHQLTSLQQKDRDELLKWWQPKWGIKCEAPLCP